MINEKYFHCSQLYDLNRCFVNLQLKIKAIMIRMTYKIKYFCPFEIAFQLMFKVKIWMQNTDNNNNTIRYYYFNYTYNIYTIN